MNPNPKNRQLAELVSTSIKRPVVLLETNNPAARLNRAATVALRREEAKQPLDSGANHARHHGSRRTKS